MDQRLPCGTGLVITICVCLASMLLLKMCMRVEHSYYTRRYLVDTFPWVLLQFLTPIIIQNIGGVIATVFEKYLARVLLTFTPDFFFIRRLRPTVKKWWKS